LKYDQTIPDHTDNFGYLRGVGLHTCLRLAQGHLLACGGCVNFCGDVLRELTHIDLFSGIGGFALAARWAGIKTVQFVEIDKFCQKVLQKNFPGVPIHDDIKTFTNAGCKRSTVNEEQTTGIEQCNNVIANSEGGKPREQTEPEGRKNIGGGNSEGSPFLLTGGFPCQPFSCAGKRKGTADDRHLWPHMLRVIKEFNPEWIIGENVGGIINIKNLVEQGGDVDMEDEADNGGEDSGSTSVLVSILSDLNQAGYSVQLFLLPACAVNAPHRRDRVWIVANAKGGDAGQSKISNTRREREIVSENRFGLWGEFSGSDRHAPDTSNQGLQGSEETGNTGIDRTESRNKLPGRFITTQWEQDWYSVAIRTCVRGVDDGVSRKVDRTNRLKSLGNSVVPMIPFLLMKAILEVENVKP